MSSRTPAQVRNVQHPPNLQQCHPSLIVFLMPLTSTDFNQILNLALSKPVQTIHNVMRDTSPCQEYPNHHQIKLRTLKTNKTIATRLIIAELSLFFILFEHSNYFYGFKLFLITVLPLTGQLCCS